MRLRFSESRIASIAARYSYPKEEEKLISLRTGVRETGHITKDQLYLIARWKSPRSAGRVEDNSASFVREITRFCLSAADERARIEPLTLLSGVLWPTASVILHLFHKDRYPILDYRALWSVSTNVPHVYDFAFWEKYLSFTRGIARRTSLTMRTIDRALWQYSKENQPGR